MILDEWIPKSGSIFWVFPGETGEVPWSLQSGHTETPASERRAGRSLGIKPFTLEQLRGSLVSPRSQAAAIVKPESDESENDTPLDELAYAAKLQTCGQPLVAPSYGTFTDGTHRPGRTSLKPCGPEVTPSGRRLNRG